MQVLGSEFITQPSVGALAFTGLNLDQLMLVAVALLAFGGIAVRKARSRKTS